jgi:phosphatidylinositol kinase/protein kinase (PI-3  family)
MAILWHEMWHEALEEASRLYFGESNVAGMLAVLTPLHEMMDKMGATTLKEIAFVQVLLGFLAGLRFMQPDSQSSQSACLEAG